MKKWVKIVINKSNRITKINKNKNFEDFVEEDRIKKGHEEGGYTSNQYYKDKDIFFNYYLKGRCLILNNYLRDNLYSEKEILSLGAGRGINELSLISNNYNITCSDIEIPQCYEASKKIFGDFKYVKFDILKDKIQSKFDYIFSLSTFYLFNDKELEKILININNILNKDGILILEFPGSEDNLTSFIFHEIFLVMEVYIIYYLSKLLNKKIGFTIDNNFGYRRKNKEIEKFAKKYGFQLIEIKEYDYLEELKRSIFIEKIIKHFPKSKKIFSFFGKQIPYVRMFKFKKE